MMKAPLLPLPRLFAAFLAAILPAGTASAQTILLDFGTETAQGTWLTNTPGHAAGALGPSDDVWNQVQLSDLSGLVDSTGGATSVGVDLGISGTTAASTIINLGVNPAGLNAPNANVNSGILMNTSVGRDGINTTATNNGGSPAFAIGARITGLAAGTYNIFMTASNNVASPTPYAMSVFAGASSGVGTTFDFSGFSSQTIANSTAGATWLDSWTEGVTYEVLTVTLAAGESLDIAAQAAGAASLRGYLNSIEIVAVPEPSAGAMAAGGLGLLLLTSHGRQRRSSRS